MILPTRSFATIVANISTSMQGRIGGTLLDFALGSVLRSIAEAIAGILLWLQGLVVAVAKLTRLSTSFGSDVDSFIADFFDPPPGQATWRNPPNASSGLVTLSRFSAAPTQVVVPVGTKVQTGDGKTTFLVVARTYDPSFSVALNGYLLPPGVASVVVPVRCAVAGSVGNAGVGAISQLGSSCPGVDLVANANALVDGNDGESDPQVKIRFRNAIASLSKGTVAAIQAAIAALGIGLTCVVQENVTLAGVPDPGRCTVIVDDGTGAISSASLALASNALQGVRAGGIRAYAFAAVTVPAAIALRVVAGVGYDQPTVESQVGAAIRLAIDALGQDVDLGFYQIGAWALAVPGCAKVEGLVLNGLQGVDLACGPLGTIKCAGVTFS